MAARPIWRGHLRVALVSCPVALHSVERPSGDLHFHLINPETGHRVRMVTLDAESDQEVARRDLVKGYEFEKDRYVLLEDDDFEKARIESSSTLTVSKFVDRATIAPIYFNTSYYVAPDGEAGEDVFVVLRDAMLKTGQAALSRVVIGQRERAVAILPMGTGMVCHTLHEPRELHSAADLFDGLGKLKPDPQMVTLATQLIERQEGSFTAEDSEDRYEARLRAVIDAKLRGEGIEPEAEDVPDRDNVIDLMAALKQSLGSRGASRRSATRGQPSADQGDGDEPKSARPAGKARSTSGAGKMARTARKKQSSMSRHSTPKETANAPAVTEESPHIRKQRRRA
jgi:DNA end-binding protein Ku